MVSSEAKQRGRRQSRAAQKGSADALQVARREVPQCGMRQSGELSLTKLTKLLASQVWKDYITQKKKQPPLFATVSHTPVD